MRDTWPMLLVLAFAIAGEAQAQKPVTWEAKTRESSVAPGGKVTIVITAAIDFGWHLYGLKQSSGGPIATRIELPKGQPFALADSVVSATEPRTEFDNNFGMEVEWHEVEAVFELPVAVASDADTAVSAVKVNARYQACNDTICLPPRTERLTVPVSVQNRPRNAVSSRSQ